MPCLSDHFCSTQTTVSLTWYPLEWHQMTKIFPDELMYRYVVHERHIEHYWSPSVCFPLSHFYHHLLFTSLWAAQRKKSSTRFNAYGNAIEVCATVNIVNGMLFHTPLGTLLNVTQINSPVLSKNCGVKYRNKSHNFHNKRCKGSRSSSISFQNSCAIQKNSVVYFIMYCDMTGTTIFVCA